MLGFSSCKIPSEADSMAGAAGGGLAPGAKEQGKREGAQDVV